MASLIEFQDQTSVELLSPCKKFMSPLSDVPDWQGSFQQPNLACNMKGILRRPAKLLSDIDVPAFHVLAWFCNWQLVNRLPLWKLQGCMCIKQSQVFVHSRNTPADLPEVELWTAEIFHALFIQVNQRCSYVIFHGSPSAKYVTHRKSHCLGIVHIPTESATWASPAH